MGDNLVDKWGITFCKKRSYCPANQTILSSKKSIGPANGSIAHGAKLSTKLSTRLSTNAERAAIRPRRKIRRYFLSYPPKRGVPITIS